MRRIFLLFLAFVITSSIAVGGVNSAKITPERSVDVPHRTVSFENQTFEITQVGNYKTNQEIRFTVDAPDVEDMLIVLYDRDKLSTWFKSFSGTGGNVSAVIPADKTGEAGMYALVVSHERNIIGAIPVVISDYDLTVTPNSRQIAANKTLDVEVRISRRGVPVGVNNTVKVVLAKGSSSIESVAQATKVGVYEAHIGIPLSANGTFSLYSVITTERNIYLKYPEIVGIESGGYIEVLPPPAEKTPFVNGAVTLVILLVAALSMRKRL